ncbi:GTPase [Stenotrophomonas sp.]|uniref:GTPase n=1 Tax=Stenotrophomonas sp. TaxID=69392 RepID=UPI0028B0FCF9|nr:GTPase [Stenotrophomonas sp.]
MNLPLLLEPPAIRLATELLPQHITALERMARLSRCSAVPVVTVVGKFNHGKSRLLNELSARDAFAVADRRQTTQLAEITAGNIQWLDAPGLDADTLGEDDALARHACHVAADLRLFVHSAKEGELDHAELALLQALAREHADCGRPVFIVLSQIDQMADANALARIQALLATQLPGLPVFPVSSVRHAKGVQDGKRLLVEASGIPALQAAIAATCVQIEPLRAREFEGLRTRLDAGLQDITEQRRAAVQQLDAELATARQAFIAGLDAVLLKAADEVAVLQPVPDDAPADLPSSQFSSGRSLRSKIITGHLLASAKINLSLSSYLGAHGVDALPPDPSRPPTTMDTVLVAVLGISVKFLDDLRRLFCGSEGPERLRREFLHYFDVSQERVQRLQQRALLQRELERASDAQSGLASLPAPGSLQ